MYKAGQWCDFGGITPSGNAHKVWVGRVDVLRRGPHPPPPAVSARLYLDRMAELSLKQFLPSVCITHQIVWRSDSFIARQWWPARPGCRSPLASITSLRLHIIKRN